MNLSPYPSYKPSGVEWLGEVPAHWEVKKLRHLALLKSGESITSEQIDETGEYPVFGGNGIRGYSSRYTHRGSYVLIGRQGALCGNINYASGQFWASEHAVVVSPLTDFATIWMGELLGAMNLNQYSVSAAQPGLSVQTISALKIPVPPPAEQRVIADLLARETAKLDTLVGKKRTLIEQLTERRTALISRTVTRGLPPEAARATGFDPHPNLKLSGIDWLGDVPEHWVVVAVKRIVVTPITDGPHETPEFLDEGVPFVSAEGVWEGKVHLSSVRGFIDEETHRRYARKYLPRRDDILVVKSGSTTGKVAIVDFDDEFNVWSPLAAIRCDANVAVPKFIFYALGSEYFQGLVRVSWSFGTQPNIGMNVLGNLQVLVPPVKEQRAIANLLDIEVGRIDQMTATIQAAIDRLQEYRTALITAAVTGKIDARGERADNKAVCP